MIVNETPSWPSIDWHTVIPRLFLKSIRNEQPKPCGPVEVKHSSNLERKEAGEHLFRRVGRQRYHNLLSTSPSVFTYGMEKRGTVDCQVVPTVLPPREIAEPHMGKEKEHGNVSDGNVYARHKFNTGSVMISNDYPTHLL